MKKSVFIEKIKTYVLENRSSNNIIIRTGIRGLTILYRIFRKIKLLITNKEYRSVQSMLFFHSKKVQQTTQLTWEDRYPDIFSACANYFKDQKSIKILSFGCCTGEEVITLRRYFPDATIVGAEINKHSLKICKERDVDDKICFIESVHERIKEKGPFDLVFCMAVLQRTPHKIINEKINDLRKIYPYDKFERQILELDQYVNNNGLLVLHHTQYDFSDTKVYEKYTTYGNLGHIATKFDTNSQLVNSAEFIHSIFKKEMGHASNSRNSTT